MDKCIFDEINGLWYELQGDYYIPCLILSEEETQPIGLWGQHHKQYLKEHRHIVYTTMLIEGTLNRYLADINQQAEQMFHRLIEEMAQKQGVTEQLKAKQALHRQQLAENRQRALEKKNYTKRLVDIGKMVLEFLPDASTMNEAEIREVLKKILSK